jgi:hypothetical protein
MVKVAKKINDDKYFDTEAVHSFAKILTRQKDRER